METEKAIDILANCIDDYVISSYCNNTCDEEVDCKNEDCIFHQAIETVINSYLKEKARADKLERDYSKALTKIDELQADLYEANNIISDYIDITAKQEKMIKKIHENFCKFDWKNSNGEQVHNQLKELYESIFRNEEAE